MSKAETSNTAVGPPHCDNLVPGCFSIIYFNGEESLIQTELISEVVLYTALR